MFVGSHVGSVKAGGRLSVPPSLANEFQRDAVGGRPLLIFPGPDDGALTITSLAAAETYSWLSGGASTLEAGLASRRPRPTPAAWADDLVVPSIRRLEDALTAESRTSSGAVAAGTAFERLIEGVLRDFGLRLDANVRLVGAEVDLLALASNEAGQTRFTIIECKHFSTSQRPVQLAQVMRLFALREAVRESGVPADAMIVTSTGLSPQGRRYAKTFAIRVKSPTELVEWAARRAPVETRPRAPVFIVRPLASDNRVALPPFALRWIEGWAPEKALLLVGAGSRVEIWDSERFEAHAADVRSRFIALVDSLGLRSPANSGTDAELTI